MVLLSHRGNVGFSKAKKSFSGGMLEFKNEAEVVGGGLSNANFYTSGVPGMNFAPQEAKTLRVKDNIDPFKSGKELGAIPLNPLKSTSLTELNDIKFKLFKKSKKSSKNAILKL